MSKKKRYEEYDYEADTELINHANERMIEKLLHDRKIKSVYTTKTIKAGKVFEVEIYPAFTKKQCKQQGLKKKNNIHQKNLNDKNARKKLERLIHANFKAGDLYITFTYDNKHLPSSIEEAMKNMKNFIRRVNYKREKLGMEKAKYIYITEYSEEKKIRCHHHLLMSGDMSIDVVEKMWKYGRKNLRRIEPDENETLTGLAKYLSKDPAGKKRWCSSTNLKKPKESKSYSAFRSSHVRRMVENQEKVKELLEKKYKKMCFISQEVKYNEINGYFYVYVRMTERRNI